jgi:hypothetical protein
MVLSWQRATFAGRLARMEEATVRERESRVSVEYIRRSQELLSEPVPKTPARHSDLARFPSGLV